MFIAFFYAAGVSRSRDPRHVSADPEAGAGRREPGLGRPPELASGRPMRRPPGPPRRDEVAAWTRRHWRAIAIGAGAFLLLLLVLRQPLADRLWPQNHAQALRHQAEAALQRGHLSALDGSGARELYEAVLAMDPDRLEPRQGLARVALAALDQARHETEAGRFEQAHAALRLATELSAPREQTLAVAGELRAREAEDAGLDDLRAQAAQAYQAGHLHGDEAAALPLYRRILRFDPDDLEALRARDDAIGELLQRARGSLRRGEFSEASALVAVAREFDRGHVDLPDTEARLSEELEAALHQAGRDLEAGRFERAEDGYRALLDVDGDDGEAAAGLVQLGVAHARRGERLAGDFRFADADAAMRRAHALAPGHPQVQAAGEGIEASRSRHAQLEPALPPGEREARVKALLEQARLAEWRGDLLSPPGDSAYDKLRAARALAPDDPDVRAATVRLLPVARECFERELRSNSLGRARVCLDARAALADDARALAQARRRLAQRWLAVGDERMAAGELASAQAALQSARDIDGSTPELAEFARRLRTASASSD